MRPVVVYLKNHFGGAGMRYSWRWNVLLVIVALFGAPAESFAQIGIGDVIGNRTLRLSSGVDLGLTKFGPDLVTGSVTAFAAVRDIQAVMNTVLPVINKQIVCKNRDLLEGGGRLQSISINGSTALPNGLVLSTTGDFADCLTGWVGGQAQISIPILISNTALSVKLSVGTVIVGDGRNAWQRKIAAVIASKIAPVTAQLNGYIGMQLSGQALRRQADAYKLKINSVQLAADTGDLILTVKLSGQAKVQELDVLFVGTPGI
jgi:hypothetical protein